MAQAWILHGQGQADASTNRDRIIDLQKHTADAYVSADARKFPDCAPGGETEQYRKLQVKSGMPSFLPGCIEIWGMKHKLFAPSIPVLTKAISRRDY